MLDNGDLTMNRKELIINFLKQDNILVSIGKRPENIKPHYNLRQINIFSGLKVTQNELDSLEKQGLINHYWFYDHGNCYYVI